MRKAVDDSLNRASLKPLRDQLVERLIDEIKRLKVGGQLPTEEALMRTYGVARTTVRSAVQVLVDEGLVVRRQGKGTFIISPHVRHSLDRLQPFLETLTTSGASLETKVLDFRWVVGDGVPAELGGPSRGALSFHRLYLTEGHPLALVRVFVADTFRTRLVRADVETTPILRALERLEVPLSDATITIRACPASREIATALSIKPRTPLLLMKRVTYARGRNAVELSTHYMRSDVYELNLHVPTDESLHIKLGPSARRLRSHTMTQSEVLSAAVPVGGQLGPTSRRQACQSRTDGGAF